MDNVSKLGILRRSIMRHNGRNISNVHVIMPDEPSESAQNWLENVRKESFTHDRDIPFIDDSPENDAKYIVKNLESDIISVPLNRHAEALQMTNLVESFESDRKKIYSPPKSFISNIFRKSRRKTGSNNSFDKEELGSALYDKHMRRSITFNGHVDNSVSIIGRSETVVEQAEAKRAFKRRNSIKKRMMRKIGKSLETLTPKEKESKRKDSKTGSQTNASYQNEAMHFSEIAKKTFDDNAKDASNKHPNKKLIRSLSDLGMVKLASLKFRKNGQGRSQAASKKTMIKDWYKTYEDMCDRAQKLELAIKIAEDEELAVKPVNSFMVKEDDKDKVKESKRDRFKRKMTTEGSFYSLQSVTSSDTEVWDEIISEIDTMKSKDVTHHSSCEVIKQKRKKFKEKSHSFNSFNTSIG